MNQNQARTHKAIRRAGIKRGMRIAYHEVWQALEEYNKTAAEPVRLIVPPIEATLALAEGGRLNATVAERVARKVWTQADGDPVVAKRLFGDPVAVYILSMLARAEQFLPVR